MVEEVTQQDRDAVQAFHRTMAEKLMADITSGKPPAFGDDAGHDGDTIHQAFARHRLTSTEALRAEIAARDAEVARLREALEAISIGSARRRFIGSQYAGLLARTIARQALQGQPHEQ